MLGRIFGRLFGSAPRIIDMAPPAPPAPEPYPTVDDSVPFLAGLFSLTRTPLTCASVRTLAREQEWPVADESTGFDVTFHVTEGLPLWCGPCDHAEPISAWLTAQWYYPDEDAPEDSPTVRAAFDHAYETLAGAVHNQLGDAAASAEVVTTPAQSPPFRSMTWTGLYGVLIVAQVQRDELFGPEVAVVLRPWQTGASLPPPL